MRFRARLIENGTLAGIEVEPHEYDIRGRRDGEAADRSPFRLQTAEAFMAMQSEERKLDRLQTQG